MSPAPVITVTRTFGIGVGLLDRLASSEPQAARIEAVVLGGIVEVMVARGPSMASRTGVGHVAAKVAEPVAKSDRARHIAARRIAEHDLFRPLADMRFALREVAGLAGVAALPGYEHATDDTIDAVLEEAAKLAGNGLAPLNRDGDKVGAKLENGVVRTAPGFAGDLQANSSRAAGTPCRSIPTSAARACRGCWPRVQEMWQAANMGFGLVPLLNQGAIDALHHHGSDRPEGHLPAKMISGEWTGTMNLTEPQAGSDLGQLKSRAREDRRPLPRDRPEDLHHLGRARHGREHRASRAGAHAGCAGGRARHLAVHRPEVPGRRRRQARASATTCSACRWSTSWASTAARPASCPSGTMAARWAIWSARKAAASPTCSP